MDNYKKVRSLLGVKFNSLESEHNRGFLKYNRWRFGKKAKILVVFAIIFVLLISIFAWLSTGTQSKPSIYDFISNGTITTPTPTRQPTPNSTQTKTPTGASIFGQILNDAYTNLAEIVAPPKPLGPIEKFQNTNSTMWKEVAANAWVFFQPGKGIEKTTGLPGSSEDYSAFTDWDLGSYIQAVIDAQKIGLIGTGGEWNSSGRLEKVVRFLETRELNSTTKYPYWFYQSKDGNNYKVNSDKATTDVDIIDTGRLFVALNNLRIFNSSLATRINDIVIYGRFYNESDGLFYKRSNYTALVPSIKAESLVSNSIYFYFVASGFASFWPNELSSAPTKILDNIFSNGNVLTPEGILLPKAAITCDPLLYSFFELNNTSPRIKTLLNQVYFAHEAYYNSTGKYRAFSEGPSLSNEWVWEWVVLPDNRTWAPLNAMYQNVTNPPIIYNKVAISFLSIYNTTFAKNMSIYLEKKLPESKYYGFFEGVDESGTELDSGVYCNTNGLILAAALYGSRYYQ